MNKEQLYYFVNVVDCGSINKAAEKLYMSQPSLSRSIRSLEEEVGFSLIERSAKGIRATPTGKTMYYYAQSIIGQFQMIERLKSIPNKLVYSNLSISIANIFLPDNLILEFYKLVDAADNEINLYETTSELVLNNVIHRKSELGILVLNNSQIQIFKKMCESHDIEIISLGRSPLYIHTNDTIFPNGIESINAEELLNRTFVKTSIDFYSNLNNSLNVDNVNLGSFSRNIVTNNYHTAIKMIKNVDAFLLGHRWNIEELKQTNIASYKINNSDFIEKQLLVLKRKKEIMSDAAASFLTLIKEHYH